MIFKPLFFALSALPFIRAQIAVGYYAGWHADEGFPLSSVSWSKYTAVNYAFAETTDDVHVLSLEGSNPEVFPEFVAAAKSNGVKAFISIGGWTGSRFFSSAVGSAENRTAFVNTVVTFAAQWQLDGVDLDWEYPNNQGLGCNTINANDTANYLAFLQELRAHPLGEKLEVSAAVSINPFMNAEGSPSANVSAFSEVFDYLVVMNYDLWGSWSSSVGPNGALNDTCAEAPNQQGSAVHAVKRWTSAGFPKEKLLLGLPAYGHSFSVKSEDAWVNGTETLALYAPFNSTIRPVGDSWDDPAGEIDACGVATQQAGVVTFWGLVEQGYLDDSGKALVPYIFDNCSQTPFVYNTTTQVMISYDNADSFAAKGQYVKDSGLGGIAIWEAGGDHKDILLDSVRSKLFST